MALFAGTYENKVDSKGRISVPAPFRAELEGQRANQLFLFPSFTCGAIEAGPVEWMEEIKQGLKDRREFSKERRALTTAIFGRARPVRLDDMGRLVMPRDFAQFAGISGRATFVGQADTFQIWEPAAAQKAQEEAVRQVIENGLTLGPGGGN